MQTYLEGMARAGLLDVRETGRALCATKRGSREGKLPGEAQGGEGGEKKLTEAQSLLKASHPPSLEAEGRDRHAALLHAVRTHGSAYVHFRALARSHSCTCQT